MKKVVYFIAIIAITGITFTGCEKPELQQAESSTINKRQKAPTACEDVLPVDVDVLITRELDGGNYAYAHAIGTVYVCANDGRICSTDLIFKIITDNTFNSVHGYIEFDAYLLDEYRSLDYTPTNSVWEFKFYIDGILFSDSFIYQVGSIVLDYGYIKAIWHGMLQEAGLE